MNLFRKSSLFVAMLASSAAGHAAALTFEVMGELKDGYYGYANHSPERYRFTSVKNRVPTIYQPTSSGCERLVNYSSIKFWQNNDKGIYIKVGNSPTHAATLRNLPGRIHKGKAPAEDVTTANHVRCTGQIKRVSE